MMNNNVPSYSKALEHICSELHAISSNVPYTRATAISALKVVCLLLQSINTTDRPLATPIIRLMSELEDLDDGVIGPFLKTCRSSNRPRLATETEVPKAYAVWSVGRLMAYQTSAEEACRFIANELTASGYVFLGRLNTPHWKSVRQWRAEMSKLPSEHLRHQIVRELSISELMPKDLTQLKVHFSDAVRKAAPYWL